MTSDKKTVRRYWEVAGVEVEALTASEARARYKDRTGLPRVPAGVKPKLLREVVESAPKNQ